MEVSGPVGVKRITIGLPNHVNAASTSSDSNGRRMSRLVSIVARTGCYPLRDRQILFLVRLSLQDCFSLRRVYLRLRVCFLLLFPERKTNIVPTGGSDGQGSLHGSLIRPGRGSLSGPLAWAAKGWEMSAHSRSI